MSRKYLNEKWCVRCGRISPTPYLRDNWELITKKDINKSVLDVGCGNGRNINFLKSLGFKNVLGVDMAAGDDCKGIVLGKDSLPACESNSSHTWDVILANYILMFLSPKERDSVINDIDSLASKNAFLMVELYAAKDSYAKNAHELLELKTELVDELESLGWKKIKSAKERFIMQRI